MFYAELLLIECSEADPGEEAGKLLQRLRRPGRVRCSPSPHLHLQANVKFRRGAADVNTALLTLLWITEIGRR